MKAILFTCAKLNFGCPLSLKHCSSILLPCLNKWPCPLSVSQGIILSFYCFTFLFPSFKQVLFIPFPYYIAQSILFIPQPHPGPSCESTWITAAASLLASLPHVPPLHYLHTAVTEGHHFNKHISKILWWIASAGKVIPSPHKNLYKNVYTSFINNCQNLEAAKMYFSR